jgi:membrane associated rhomboid family serine protease
MGLYDREYYREGVRVRLMNPLGPEWKTSAVTWLIAINVAVFFVQLILRRYDADEFLYCSPERVIGRGEVWRLLTAAFCHDTLDLGHIFMNMIVLMFFGPQIERLYGRRDFVAFYLTVAVVANLVFCAIPYLTGGSVHGWVLGASGCCMAIVVLTAFYFPNQIVIFIFIPLPLWLLGGFLVVYNLFGFLQAGPGARIAFVVHLAGMAMGALYRYVDLRLSTLLAHLGRIRIGARRRPARRDEPEFRVPSDGIPRFVEDLEQQKLDRILEKISRFGRESLSDDDVAFLNRMSDRYRGQR